MQRLRKLIVHLDIYIAIAVAVGSSIYAAIAQENNKTTNVIIGSLTAIIIAVLGIRSRLDELLTRPATFAGGGSMSETLPPDFEARIERATEVWITGVHRSEFLLAHWPVLERAVKRGIKLRFIFAHPDGHAVKMAALRFPIVGDSTVDDKRSDQESHKLRQSIAVNHL